METWRAVPTHPAYEVSDHGTVRRALDKKLLSIQANQHGYNYVKLWRDGKQTHHYVHRLVLLAFVGQPSEEADQTCHKNSDKNDNRLTNLMWGSRYENEHHKYYGCGNAFLEDTPF